MSFWIPALIIAILSLAPLMLTVRRKYRAQSQVQDQTQIKIYKDQLSEVERDLERGTLNEAEAKRTRIEISRRLLEADKYARRSHGRTGALPLWSILIGAGGVLLGSFALYSSLGAPTYQDFPLERRLVLAQEAREARPSQDTAEQAASQTPLPSAAHPDHVQLVLKLAEALQSRQDDLQGHILLSQNAATIGQYRLSYAAQNRVIALKGADASAQDYADLADAMVLSVNGYVSPEAEKIITVALAKDKENGVANYYAGEMFRQTGRPDLTLSIWSKLLEKSQADDPWVAPVAANIEAVAALAGVRYTLPDVRALGSPELHGPTAQDIEASADMSEEDRAAFIQSMVDSLAARLANSGGSPEEWAQLITALAVSGDTERATVIWNEAQVLYSAEPVALDVIRSAAKSAGVTP